MKQKQRSSLVVLSGSKERRADTGLFDQGVQIQGDYGDSEVTAVSLGEGR